MGARAVRILELVDAEAAVLLGADALLLLRKAVADDDVILRAVLLLDAGSFYARTIRRIDEDHSGRAALGLPLCFGCRIGRGERPRIGLCSGRPIPDRSRRQSAGIAGGRCGSRWWDAREGNARGRRLGLSARGEETGQRPETASARRCSSPPFHGRADYRGRASAGILFGG